jgi:enoyl-CoA hydratase/carnithine racemase
MRVAEFETLLVERGGGVATVTLNRPEQRNAINLAMQQELHDAIWGLDADESVRAIVVTGAGKAFCSGIDMAEGGFGADFQAEHDRTLGVTSDTIWKSVAFWELATPVIGAINGAAVGAGLTLPLLFDWCMVAEDARLQFMFTRLGVAPDAGSTWLVPRLVGLPRALELLVTGRPFTGSEAAAIGLCTRALPADEVLGAAQELGRDLAENTAPLAVAVTKRLVHEFAHRDERPDAMTRETKLIWWLGSRPDATEGPMARIEKRPARWSDDKRTPPPPDLA